MGPWSLGPWCLGALVLGALMSWCLDVLVPFRCTINNNYKARTWTVGKWMVEEPVDRGLAGVGVLQGLSRWIHYGGRVLFDQGPFDVRLRGRLTHHSPTPLGGCPVLPDGSLDASTGISDRVVGGVTDVPLSGLHVRSC